MNSNKISCQKYVFEQNEYNSSPILELSVKFASQICHENTNKPLDGTYLADFGIDISANIIDIMMGFPCSRSRVGYGVSQKILHILQTNFDEKQ